MAKTNTVVIAEIQMTLKQIEKDIAEIKESSVSKEAYTNLNERIMKIESSISKITWAIIMAVLGALLSLVIKGI